VGECLYCPPSPSSRSVLSPNPFSPSPVASDQPTPAQLLLVAEECLARAQPEKAAELAARALAVRPDSLEAKAVVDRARRLLARQRRHRRQEERLKEAQALLEAGDSGGAEKLVLSVLKRMPGHPAALALFSRVKSRRLARGDAEAEAEKELARMAEGQARRAAEAARSARGAGWDGKAMLALRRGLRLAPDDPDLLALLRETEHALGDQDRAGARRRAANVQVRAALDKLKEGRLEESLAALRSLLRQDPDHARAQAAVQEVRRAWLARAPVPTPPAAPAPAPTGTVTPRTPPASPSSPPRTTAPLPSAPRAPAAARPPSPRPHPIAPPSPPVASPPRPHEAPRRALTGAAAAPPAEIARRPTRRGAPLFLVLASAAVVFGLFVVLTARPPNRAVPRAAAPTTSSAAPRVTAPPATPPPAGPLATADPEVREAVETTLTAYARALESQDPLLLARARPDLTGAERERLLAPFRGAINVATDLRVLDVVPSRGAVVVPVLRTDVIVGGRGAPPAPVEETLRFERRDGMWRLVAGSAR
jgi:tetratricopeptide (TPR) repeat protein